jgi:threonine dehydratase
MPNFPSLTDIQAARGLLGGLIRQMPFVEVRPGELASDPDLSSTLVFKLELFQITGTFKPRGVIAAGARADLIALDESPLKNPRVFAKAGAMPLIMKGGRFVHRNV